MNWHLGDIPTWKIIPNGFKSLDNLLALISLIHSLHPTWCKSTHFQWCLSHLQRIDLRGVLKNHTPVVREAWLSSILSSWESQVEALWFVCMGLAISSTSVIICMGRSYIDILDKPCIFPYFVIWKMAKDEAVSNYPSIQWWKTPLNWTFARSIQFHKCWSFNEHWIARSIYWLVMI